MSKPEIQMKRGKKQFARNSSPSFSQQADMFKVPTQPTDWSIIAPLLPASIRSFLRLTCKAFCIKKWQGTLILNLTASRFMNTVRHCTQVTRLEIATALQLSISQHLTPFVKLQSAKFCLVGSGQFLVDEPYPLQGPTILTHLSVFFADGASPEASFQGAPNYWWGILRKLRHFETNSITPLLLAAVFLSSKKFQIEEGGIKLHTCIVADPAVTRQRHAGSAESLILMPGFVDTAVVRDNMGWSSRIPDDYPLLAEEIKNLADMFQGWLSCPNQAMQLLVIPQAIHEKYSLSKHWSNAAPLSTTIGISVKNEQLTHTAPIQSQSQQQPIVYINYAGQGPISHISHETASQHCSMVVGISGNIMLRPAVNLHSMVGGNNGNNKMAWSWTLRKSTVASPIIIYHDKIVSTFLMRYTSVVWDETMIQQLVESLMNAVKEAETLVLSLLVDDDDDKALAVERHHIITWPSPLDLCGDNGTGTIHGIGAVHDYSGQRYKAYVSLWYSGRLVHIIRQVFESELENATVISTTKEQPSFIHRDTCIRII